MRGSSPVLSLCGESDYPFNYYNHPAQASGTTIRNSNGARALILGKKGAYESCPGSAPGVSYFVHMRPPRPPLDPGEELYFQPNDILCADDPPYPEPCSEISNAVVEAVPRGFVVDFDTGVDERVWWSDLPALKDDILALEDVIRESHWTAWVAKCLGVVDDDGPVVAQFGDNGYACGTRTHDGIGYILVANTWHEVDSDADWGNQYVGKEMTMTVTVEDLDYQPGAHPEFFDFENNVWVEDTSVWVIPVTDGWEFEFQLPALGTAAIRLVSTSP